MKNRNNKSDRTATKKKPPSKASNPLSQTLARKPEHPKRKTKKNPFLKAPATLRNDKQKRRATKPRMTVAVPTTVPNVTIPAAEVNGQVVQVVPPPPDPELVALADLDRKLLVARDRIRMVARGQTPGFYWHGRPGTCKTNTVLTVLDEMGVKYHYHKGNITQGGLLEIMAKYHDGIIVLDDLSAILDDKKAVQYLLAALGRQSGKPLPMGYVRQGKQITFEFTGGIICISNLPVPPKGMLAAFKSRVHTLGHSPTDLMLIGLARHRICKNGWPVPEPKLTVEQVNEAINWVWDESNRLKVPVDLRVLFEKAFPDYIAWAKKETEAHWKDLVTTTLEEEVNSLAFTPPTGIKRGVRQAIKEEEWEIVRAILKDHTERRDRIWAWQQRTKKSEKAFERRWAEVKVQDTSK